VRIAFHVIKILKGVPMISTEEQVTRQVRGHEDTWRDLIRAGNWDGVAALLADDYTNTDADGNVWTKDVDIDNCKYGRYKVHSLSEPEELHLRAYGADCVIVTGRDRVKAEFNGQDVSGCYRWTDTFVKISEQWVCVASHSSKIPD
jgi:ketosteroid isomerase-like protein